MVIMMHTPPPARNAVALVFAIAAAHAASGARGPLADAAATIDAGGGSMKSECDYGLEAVFCQVVHTCTCSVHANTQSYEHGHPSTEKNDDSYLHSYVSRCPRMIRTKGSVGEGWAGKWGSLARSRSQTHTHRHRLV